MVEGEGGEKCLNRCQSRGRGDVGDAHEVGDGPGKTCSFPNKWPLTCSTAEKRERKRKGKVRPQRGACPRRI